jgi:glycosyltransferase involved in cell wall biosynthesis
VHRIPNGVDTRLFRPVTHQERISLRARLGLPSGPVVVYTGRLVSYKGLPLLVEAWRQLVPEHPGAVLVLVGEGGGDMHDCEPALREFVVRHGLESQVRFTGPVGNVQDWLQAADAFVFPTENEAFGLSLVEAMACGLPAVTTRVGGLRDFVAHGVNAWAIEPADGDGMAEGLRAVLADPDLAARLGAAARETVLARFGEDAVAHAYEQLLDAACRASRQGVAA